MKKTIMATVLCLGVALVALATSPIAFHPSPPRITATKAIELAAHFGGDLTNNARYCSSVILNEAALVPAPRGSARHWVVTFQDAGAARAVVTCVYVDMEGHASDSVPPAIK
jgi:hypothetical protein